MDSWQKLCKFLPAGMRSASFWIFWGGLMTPSRHSLCMDQLPRGRRALCVRQCESWSVPTRTWLVGPATARASCSNPYWTSCKAMSDQWPTITPACVVVRKCWISRSSCQGLANRLCLARPSSRSGNTILPRCVLCCPDHCWKKKMVLT